MSKTAMKLALEALENSVDLVREDAYEAKKLYGNYPTRQGKVNGLKVLADDHEKAITALREALAEQPAQPNYRRGDRLICLETEEYCVIHISGTDRQWVKFPDTHIGVYKNEQLAELFELLPKEIEFEQPAQQEPVAYWIPKAKQFCLPSSDGTRPFAKAWEPLYTSPPAQRTWVGLTNKDIYECEPKTDWYDSVEFVQAIEAKLRSKNEDRN